MQAGGRFGVGSDSNVQISLAGELRQLEYSQRLNNCARNVLAEPNASNGRYLYDNAVKGGAAALGVSAGLVAGCPADMLSLNCEPLPYLKADQILDHWIFTEGFKIDCVWAMGEKQVENGRHRQRALINAKFLQMMKQLLTE
jgi:formimidoylglutamate deiminase